MSEHTIEEKRQDFQPLLSILIPSLTERKDQLDLLLSKLRTQIESLTDPMSVEILYLVDNREKTTGAKRNELLSTASGLFTVFVDDDDDIPPYYINEIIKPLEARHSEIDCIGFFGEYYENGKRGRDFIHSNRFGVYATSRTHFLRPPNHLNPIRREIAKKFFFQDVVMGEDSDWSMRIAKSGLLKREYYVGRGPMYYYYYKHK